jgi:hypothetical protein
MKSHAIAILLALATGTLYAEDKKPDDSRPDDYITTPWHLVDTWWDIGRDPGGT